MFYTVDSIKKIMLLNYLSVFIINKLLKCLVIYICCNIMKRSCNNFKLNKIFNFQKSLVKLWKTDISEDCIVVLMEKSNLESLLCDATTVFSELDTTV